MTSQRGGAGKESKGGGAIHDGSGRSTMAPSPGGRRNKNETSTGRNSSKGAENAYTYNTKDKSSVYRKRSRSSETTDRNFNKEGSNIDTKRSVLTSDTSAQFQSEAFYSVASSKTTVVGRDKDEEKAEQVETDADDFPKDTCRSWVACVVAYFDTMFLQGSLNIYGLFLVKFEQELGTNLAYAASLGSTTLGLMKLFGPLASFLTLRFGNRNVMVIGCLVCCASALSSSFVQDFDLLFATYSVPYALGSALTNVPAYVVPIEYFKKHRSLTQGIVASGSSTGTIILAPTIQIILDNYGWRTAYRGMSVVYLLLSLLNTRIAPSHVQKHNSSDSSNDCPKEKRSIWQDLALWNSRVFVLWVLVIAIVYFGYTIPVIFLASYAKFIGYTSKDASYVFMAMGGATTISRLATGSLMRCDLLNRLHVKQIIFVVLGTLYLLLAHVHTYEGLMVFAVARGLLDGAHVVMLPTLTASIVGAKKAILGWGHLAGALSITYILGPLAAGILKDYTGSYTGPFIMAGLPMIFSGLLLFLLPWAQRTSRRIRMLKRLNRLGGGEDDQLKEKQLMDYEDEDHAHSIQDFIQHHASALVLKQRAKRESARLSGSTKSSKRPNYSYMVVNEPGWDRPLAVSASDTYLTQQQPDVTFPQPDNGLASQSDTAVMNYQARTRKISL